jgi:hypothetical protein
LAHEYTCSVCSETLHEDSRGTLIEKVKSHAENEHDTEMSSEEIMEDIK